MKGWCPRPLDEQDVKTILKFTEWGDYHLIDLNTSANAGSILTVELNPAVGTVFTTMNFNMVMPFIVSLSGSDGIADIRYFLKPFTTF